MERNYTSEMTMLITVSSSIQPAPIHHHLSPPPTLPKPGKDNVRLQRLLKKAAKKNAVFTSEQAKSFRSSLSPVNEASPDQEEYDESTPPAETPETTASPSTSLPTHISIRPVNHRAPSPFRKSKPFTLKVTEQRRIAEHVLLTTSSAMPLLHKPEAPETTQQPEDVGSHLPSPCDPSVFPQPPPSSKERAPEVTYVTKVNTYFHSVKPPRAKTPTSNLTQGTVSHEDKRPSSPAPQTSCSEPSPEHIPTSLDDSNATLPLLEPPLLPAADTEPAADTKPADQVPKPVPIEESIKAPSPKPSTSDAHTNMPTTHGSDTEISGSETAPELPKEDRDILKQTTSSAPWRQAHPATATPAQADDTGSTSTDTKAEHITQTQLTPSLPNTHLPLKDEPAPPSVEAARPSGTSASGWHRLRKHLMVQPEAPSFPEPKPEKLEQEEGSKEDTAQAVINQDCMLFKSRAMKMWDAILYQVTLNKETKQHAEEKKPRKEENVFLPRRLPILLHKPRFDARKLKELATKPMTKISTVFELSRFRPKSAEEHTKSFNRTASGWSAN
ncbi:proteoglycan 4-like [Chiroxiphia lanceolata]|uniref:proteoglycan 4-like n=1 Tax=Chiroxiphia lanceolata TaxID=296741 RepID=UPI0013CEE30F|nr:proteoglycan 4-like [Chiroxiphia lanceolata]XP_032546493.1 proteoglycan 4-like [Chiroxiphia lanceolata]XP_032546494.1 proteoglycan 4-like [Chiroxiphia lanceolata]